MSLSSAAIDSGCAQPRALRVGRLGKFVAVVLCMSAATAPLAGQISVDRTEIVFRAVPGEPRVAFINLHNEGSARVQAVVRLEDWDRGVDGTNNWYPYATTPGSCGSLLSVFPLTVALEPDARQSIRISLDSAATLDRECWAGAIVETVQPRTVGGRSVAYVIRTATKVYIEPASALAMRGEVVALSIQPTGSDSAGRAAPELHLEFANTGGKHLKTPGEIQLRRPDNTIGATVPLPMLYTLPGARSIARVSLPTLAPGRYIVLAVLDYGGDELAAGQIEWEVR